MPPAVERTFRGVGCYAWISHLAHTQPFGFRIPDGWRDLSFGVPECNLEGVPPKLCAVAHGALKFSAFAADVAGAKNGNVAILFASVQHPTTPTSTEGFLLD